MRIALSSRHLLKTISSSYLTSQLPEAAIPVATNKTLVKKLKREKVENEIPTGRFEKLQNIPWNLLGHAPVQGYTHAQERPEKILISHLWLTLRLFSSRKWRLRPSCELPARALSTCPNTLIEPLRKSRETYWFKKFKKLTVHSLADH